jgi:hypothetical protein
MKQRSRGGERSCLCCGKPFESDRRCRGQKYCSKENCRKASKAASQRRWLSKPENQRHLCGPEHLERLRAWRRAHPAYWRQHDRKLSSQAPQAPIQDLIDRQLIDSLRKLSPANLPIQELMAHFSRHLLQLEQEKHQSSRGNHAEQTSAGV